MPSPFPGMNPFLEHPDVWSTFHTGMLAAMADRLSAQVRPDYLVHMEAHIERQRYLEIRDRRNRELVAVVELLSPVNKKSGPYRAQYLTKRSEILASPAHLVEIDLLRDGLRHTRSGAPLQHVRGDGQSRRGAACSRLLADRASTALAHDSGATTAGQFPCLSRAPKVAARGLRQGNLRRGNLRTGGRAPARSSKP